MLAALESTAARLGIAVRAEPFLKGVLDGRGGLCWLDGKAIIVMDEKLAVPDRIVVLAEALSQMELDASEVPLMALEVIRAAQRRSAATTRPKRKGHRAKRAGRPGLARAKPR